MAEEKSSEAFLRRQLAQGERKLAIIRDIDRVRDTYTEFSPLLSKTVMVLAEHFKADLTILCLKNRETGELDLKAVKDHRGLSGKIGMGVCRPLIEAAIAQNHGISWDSGKILDLGLKDLPEDLYFAAIAVFLNGETLGAILLGRKGAPFAAEDMDVLETAEDHVDSTLIQAYVYHQLAQRNKELEVIYHIDRIRDKHLALDEMLGQVLKEMQTVIQTEMSLIMLYDKSGGALELRSSTNDDLFRSSTFYDVVQWTANRSLAESRLVCDNAPAGGIRSIMCTPLILEAEVIGVLGLVNAHRRSGFNVDDQRLLSAVGSQVDTAIFEGLEKRHLKEVLGRSVDPRVMERLLSSQDMSFLKGERADISVLYGDIRGSTRLAEKSDPELLVGFINDYLATMTDVILDHQGTLDKFIGDEVMALFGAPFAQADHALRAVNVGLAMQRAHVRIITDWTGRGIAAQPIGVGIATGNLIAGEIGCEKRADYTVIGRAANLGARICSAALGGQVLICRETYEQVKDCVTAEPVTGLSFKGIGDGVTVYHVTDATPIY